ncbi:MAG: polymer-forming cytoskeletal protein [Anaerolineae bacterium]|nr:polymer-forming cytoskeletal protein [Anaerolineae bacterium]MCB0252684.1 polymer-forming cytoskeletal protein [Anaerolineae bacterium]
MKRLRLAAALLLTAILILLAVAPVFAQDTGGDKVVFGGSYRVRSGEVLSGDLAIFGGSATIEEGGVVRGDIVSMGGSLDVEGTVNGDIAVFGGSVDLASTALVTGDLVRFGGSLDVAPGAEVRGSTREGGTFDLPGMWQGRFVPPIFSPSAPSQLPFEQSPGRWLVAAFLAVLRAVAMTAGLGALALVISLIWPGGIERIGRAGEKTPFMALAVGALTWLVGLALVAIAAITICLLPLAILLALVLVAAAILSWIVTGWWVGRKLLALLNLDRPTTVLEATIGTVLVVGVYFLVGILPCVDFIYGALVASFGVGAIALTRFGTRPYPPPPLVATPVDAAPALPAGQSTAVVPGDDPD